MIPSFSSLKLGTSRLFSEATPRADSEITFDDHGFLRTSASFFTFERLLDLPCCLVVAPPWTGKTFVSERIEAILRDGRQVHRTDFAAIMPGEPFDPPNWPKWTTSSEDAVWIVDALDEQQRRDPRTWPALKKRLEEAPLAARRRLRLIIFARDGDLRELAPRLEIELRALYQDAFMKAQLLPLDAANALDLLTEEGFSAENIRETLEAVEKNQLQPLAGYPAALLYIARIRNKTALSETDVWKGVLLELLKEHSAYRKPFFQVQPEERFEATARIAAVLTLTGNESLQTSNAGDEPSIPEIFPVPPPPGLHTTRGHADEAVGSGMFRERSRFLHKNAREWMAAFGMSTLPLAKLRPILQKRLRSSGDLPSIRPEFHDLARLLLKLHCSREVQEWLLQALAEIPPGDLFPRNDSRSILPLLDRLEQLAARGGRPDWLEDSEALRRILVPGLGDELAQRINDSTKPSWARITLLRLGTALEMEEVLQAAAHIISNSSEDASLRSWCASAVAGSQRQHLLRPLQTFVEESKPATREEREIVSTLIAAFVETSLWSTVRAFRATPPGPAGEVIDSTRALPHVLERHMTDPDARAIVADLNPEEIRQLNETIEKDYQRVNRQHCPRWEIFSAAAQKLASSDPPDAVTLRLLIPFVLSLGPRTVHHESQLLGALRSGFRKSKLARRELFESTVNAQSVDQERVTWPWLYHLLTAEDLLWLEERLLSLARVLPETWTIALSLADQSTDRAAQRRVRKLVREHAPSTFGQFTRWQNEERARRRREAKEKQTEEAQKRHIHDVNRELLTTDMALERRLRLLSWVNFSEPGFRPRNLIGHWSDVPEDLQQEVLDFCLGALDSVAPTPIPEGSSFPSGVMHEAQVFLAMLRLCPERFEITSGRVERWLPAVLRTVTNDFSSVLERCLSAAPAATEGAVIDAVGRELRGESAYSTVLQNLPDLVWTDRVAAWVVEAIHGGQPTAARPALLEFLASRRPQEGRKVAADLLEQVSMQDLRRIAPETDYANPDLAGVRALDVLLALDPDLVWPHFKEGVRLSGGKLFEYLRSLTRNSRSGLDVKWQLWPAQRLGELAALLVEAYPPDQDPENDSGWVTPAHDLRRLRWNIVEHLVRSNTPDATAAIELIREVHPTAMAIADRLRASREADELRLPEPLSSEITVEQACRLLDDQYFRLIRNDEDLLEVVIEVLQRMSLDLGDDLALFYHRKDDGGYKRQHEKSLQTYVRRRLTDLLPGKVLDRETQVKHGRRLDVRIIAPVVGQADLARLVIEVKWSDNASISTALRQQLGADYLVAEPLNNGIFLVGWCGKLGKWTTGVDRPEASASSLQTAFERQAKDFSSEHSKIEIRPVVWDLERKQKIRRQVPRSRGSKV